MSVREIVVHVGDDQACEARLGLALAEAGRHGARLTGVYVAPFPGFAGFGDPSVAERVYEVVVQAIEEDRERAEALFRRVTDGTSAAARLSVTEGLASEHLIEAARCADLAIVGQDDPEDVRSVSARLMESVLLESGGPVLVAPCGLVPSTVGDRVLVAWNGSREASRALRDGMPWLTRATRVDVVSVGDPPEGDATSGEASVLELLSAHGIEASFRLVTGDTEVGEALLDVAGELGSDLVVMGGYGHSRMRELVLGGATRSLMADSGLPVLMSH